MIVIGLLMSLLATLGSGISVEEDQMMVEARHVHDMDHHNKHPDSPMMAVLTKNFVKHPYRYMRDPMASIPMTRQMIVPYMRPTMKEFIPFMQPTMKRYNMKVPFLEYNPYHHNLEPTYQDMGYMLGEQFFKEQAPGRNAEDWDAVNFRGDEEHEDQEQIPYKVIQRYESYEKRKIPSALYACVQETVDTAADPLGGIELTSHNEYIKTLRADRYQKLPSTRMFNHLFKYINGDNEREEKMDMTRPVTILHHAERRNYLGDVEIQEECFYLPALYQENHDHGPSPRHLSLVAPKPLNNSKVFLHKRPEMDIYARTFEGFPVTEEDWKVEKEQLERDLGTKHHHDNEFFTACYQSPWKMTDRRNEVWIQSIEPGHPVISAITVEDPDEDYDEDASFGQNPLDAKKAQVKSQQKVVKKKIES